MTRGALCLLGFHWLCMASALQAQLVVAHRGAAFDAPENTCASFQLAWEHGADAIEGDYYLTADNQIVCIHDDTTKRTSGKNLSVPRSTLAELQSLDVGSWKSPRFAGERIPRLQDVLTLVPANKCAYLEVKCGPEIVPKMRDILAEAKLASGQAIIISFNRDVIRAAKQAMPERHAYWLVDFTQNEETGAWSPTVDQVIAEAKRIGADGVDLDGVVEVVNEDLITRCRQTGLSVHVWTIDDPEVAIHFQRLGVASITTNRPGMLLERLSRTRGPSVKSSRVLPATGTAVQSQVSDSLSPAAQR